MSAPREKQPDDEAHKQWKKLCALLSALIKTPEFENIYGVTIGAFVRTEGAICAHAHSILATVVLTPSDIDVLNEAVSENLAIARERIAPALRN